MSFEIPHPVRVSASLGLSLTIGLKETLKGWERGDKETHEYELDLGVGRFMEKVQAKGTPEVSIGLGGAVRSVGGSGRADA